MYSTVPGISGSGSSISVGSGFLVAVGVGWMSVLVSVKLKGLTAPPPPPGRPPPPPPGSDGVALCVGVTAGVCVGVCDGAVVVGVSA